MPLNTDKVGQMGWGDLQDPVHYTVARERRAHEAEVEPEPWFCDIDEYRHRYCAKFGGDMKPLEKRLFDEMRIDGGWGFWAAERWAYGRHLKPGPQSIGNCWVPGTRVQLLDGSFRPIEQLQLHDQVLTAEGNGGAVRALGYRNVDEPVMTITPWGHHGATCTMNHPVLTKRGYVEAGDLTASDWIAMPKARFRNLHAVSTASLIEHRKYSYSNRQTKPREVRRSVGIGGDRREVVLTHYQVPDTIQLDGTFGRLVGLFLAEGSTDKARVTWSFAKDEDATLAEEVRIMLASLFGVEATTRRPVGKRVSLVDLHGRDWALFFESLCGRGAGGKRLHQDIAMCNEEFVRGLVGGWLAGDGYQRRGTNQGVTVSSDLAMQIHSAAAALGKMPVISRTTPRPTGNVKTRQTRWDVFFQEKTQNHWRAEQDATTVWRKVKSLEQVPYSGPVYNLDIPGDHSYTAEGLGSKNCVGYSHCLLLASKLAHEVLIEGDAEEPLGHYSRITPVPFIPYSYGVGRVYIGNGRIRGDGSLCSWQLKGTMQYGFLPSDTPGLPSGVPQSSASIGRSWGSSRRILDQWKDKARPFELVDSTRVTDADEAWDVLTVARTPMEICSGWGFRPHSFDRNLELWLYKRSGSWAHAMQVIGGIEIKGRQLIVIRNQWGEDAHKDPGRGIPKGSFVVPIELFANWIRDADCRTIGEMTVRSSWKDEVRSRASKQALAV